MLTVSKLIAHNLIFITLSFLSTFTAVVLHFHNISQIIQLHLRSGKYTHRLKPHLQQKEKKRNTNMAGTARLLWFSIQANHLKKH